MADVWRPRVSRAQRRDRSLGTIDGRLIQAAKVPKKNETRRPDDSLRNILFNSGPDVNSGLESPPYIASSDGVIVGLKLSVKTGSVTAKVYVQGSLKRTISHSGSGFSVIDDLDIGVDADEKITVIYTGTSATYAVTTVHFLED